MRYKLLFTYLVVERIMYYFTAPPPMMLKLLTPETKVMYLRINSLEIFEFHGMHIFKWYFNVKLHMENCFAGLTLYTFVIIVLIPECH